MVVFGAGGIITYNIFKNEIQLETDRFLDEKFNQIVQRVNEGEDVILIKDNKITFIKSNSTGVTNNLGKLSFSLIPLYIIHN